MPYDQSTPSIQLPHQASCLASLSNFDHTDSLRFIAGTHGSCLTRLTHPTRQLDCQLFLIEYFEDTLELYSQALPLSNTTDDLRTASVIEGGGLAVIRHHTGSTVDAPNSKLFSDERHKLPVASTAIVAAGFRQNGKDVLKILSVPLTPPSDLLSVPLRQSRAGRGVLTSASYPVDVIGTAVQNSQEKEFYQLKRVLLADKGESMGGTSTDQSTAVSDRLLLVEVSGPSLYSLDSQGAMVSEMFRGRTHGSCFSGAWDRHHPNKFATVGASALELWDLRADLKSQLSVSMHRAESVSWDVYGAQRDVDYNPNQQLELVTAGEDGALRFWDIRRMQFPFKTTSSLHSHWITSVKYNLFHDQLMATGGTDGSVKLWKTEIAENLNNSSSSLQCPSNGHAHHSSVASANSPTLTCKSTDQQLSKAEEQREKQHGGDLVAVQQADMHDDSVSSLIWSQQDPWIYASSGADRRLVVYQVPSTEKYTILL